MDVFNPQAVIDFCFRSFLLYGSCEKKVTVMFQVLTPRSTSKQASRVKLIAEIPEQAIEEIISIRSCGGVCAVFIQKLELQVWHHMSKETEQSLKHVEMLLNLWHVYPLRNSVWSFSEKRKLASLCSLKLKKYIYLNIYIKNSQKRKSRASYLW